ncbi:MAG: metallophosphoesterase [Bacteroidetes bacterium]|nr:metallophosphoesterase [Fibrella sp.]
MKLIAIGDLHGRDAWKQVDIEAADRVVFLGDYTDSHHFSDEVIYQNLEEIIRLKQRKPDKVILLIGNHDAQYLHYPRYRCSGFRPVAQPALSALFAKHEGLFQVAYQQESYLFTHAGLSTEWYKHRKPYLEQIDAEAPLADQLNAMHQRESTAGLLFEVGPVRGGRDRYSGPVWADRSETRTAYLLGYHQVVGHTPVSEITTLGDENGSITYCDVTQIKADFYGTTV